MHAPIDTDVPTVAQYINYHPFGEIIEDYGNKNSPFKFTGKELDEHGYFEYGYFGARYYDYITGRFTSVDRAGQYLSGYMYGGNNPIMGRDADGNWFWVAYFAYNFHRNLENGNDLWHSFKYAMFRTATAHAFAELSNSFGEIGGESALLRRNIRNTFNDLLYSGIGGQRTEFKLDLGFGAMNFTSDKFDWADFRDGDWLSDIDAWISYSKDVNWYFHLNGEERDLMRNILNKPHKTFTDDYNENIVEVDGELVDMGGYDITPEEYERYAAIGERFQNSIHILDPLSWTNFIPSNTPILKYARRYYVLNRILGINSVPESLLKGGSVHQYGYRLPGGISVSVDTDGMHRYHGAVDANIFLFGSFGHVLENILPTPTRMFLNDSYRYRVIFF